VSGRVDRPVPRPDRDSEPWWAALARHELVQQRCDDCVAWRWPPRALCGRCGSLAWSWQPVSGRGTVASWIVNHHPFLPGTDPPFTIVAVRLDEQDDIVMPGSWFGTAEPAFDQAVVAVFDDLEPNEDRTARVTLLGWEPV
jgi:uncharacterized protein